MAQVLHRHGLNPIVFERDPSAAARAQGYRLSLKDTGVRALRACLPEHLFDLAVATSIRPATRMIFMDASLRSKFAKPIPSQAPGISGLGVNRLTLREILLAGLDGHVHFGRPVTGYESLHDGRVRVRLGDGTTVDGDLLVGADGTGSAVRRQLLPEAVIDELDWAIYGMTPITSELLAATPPELVDSFNRVIGDDGTAVAVATCRPLTPVSEAVAEHAPGLSLTDIPGYFSWTLTRTGPPPAVTTPEELHELADAAVREWAPGVRNIIAAATRARTFLVKITSARPVDPWDEPAVTLLGDAVHTMSPGRGEGAGIALRDAHLLGDLITSGLAIPEAKTAYEHQMLDYGFAAVDASRNHPFAPFTKPDSTR